MDNFDNRMAAIQPGVTIRVANKLGDNPDEKMSVNLRFNKMADFAPAAVARQVPATAKLLEAREQLANLLRYMDGKVGGRRSAEEAPGRSAADGGAARTAAAELAGTNPRPRKVELKRGTVASWPKKLVASEAATQVETVEADEFAALLKQSFKPRTERAATEVENAVTTLVAQALKDTSCHQVRCPRHHRGDDRAARPEALRADERDSCTRRSSSRSKAPGAACIISSSIRRRTPTSRSG